MRTFLNNAMLHYILTVSLLLFSTAAKSTPPDSTGYCYSVYHINQKLDLAVTFGSNTNHQKTEVDIDVHVRKILASADPRDINNDNNFNVRAYVVLIDAINSKTNGIDMDISQRYHQPFMVWANGETGEIIDLLSTEKDPSILNEFLSFFDLFQYSNTNGKYHYRDGNGQYLAHIFRDNDNPVALTREKSAYLKSNNTNIDRPGNNYLHITTGKQQAECFYQKANGIESFKTTLSPKAFVEGTATVYIEADPDRSLPESHYFYTLTDNLTSWPDATTKKDISKELALSKLVSLMSQLSSNMQDQTQFLAMLQSEKDTWPYLAEYIQEYGIADDLSMELFWALDKINSTDSVSALTQLATSNLLPRERFRAVIALSSTSARLDDDDIERLFDHMGKFTDPEFSTAANLTFIRLLGAVANRRDVTAPAQSLYLREFLYRQVGNYNESANAAVIDAIGNLKDSIEPKGIEILLQEINAESEKIRLSAVSAFNRVPYNNENSKIFIEQLQTEHSQEIKHALLEVISQTDNSDIQVKQQLLSLLENPGLRQKSLDSLKQIGYTLQQDDIHLLESRLRQETDIASQRLLASLILKHRRNSN